MFAMIRGSDPLRRGAATTLLLPVLLVAALPAAEGLHEHGYGDAVEWHTDGAPDHGEDARSACPLLVAGIAPFVVHEAGPPQWQALLRRLESTQRILPSVTDPAWSATLPRGPPAA